MDLFRSFFGIPRRDGHNPFPPRNEVPPAEGLYIPENQFENDDEDYMPEHGLFGQMDQELQEMERQLKDLWSTFGLGPSLFNEGFQNLFEGFGVMPPALPPGEKMPVGSAEQQEEEAENLRRRMLKPSLAPPTSSPDHRKDLDLDGRVQKEGLAALLEDDRAVVKPPTMAPPTFKSFSRSVSVQTVRRPDGVMETRKVVRDSEGNEEVTITEHAPDGSPSTQQPGLFGPSPHHPGFFGSPGQGQPDMRGLDLFGKIFGPRY